jgi:hypothetical protein
MVLPGFGGQALLSSPLPPACQVHGPDAGVVRFPSNFEKFALEVERNKPLLRLGFFLVNAHHDPDPVISLAALIAIRCREIEGREWAGA